MNTPHRFAMASLLPMLIAVVAWPALAEDTGSARPEEAPVPASTLPRAEVLADLQIWHEAGLQALQLGDPGPEVFGAAYQSAEAHYLRMRQDPEFAALVARIARARGERIDVVGR